MHTPTMFRIAARGLIAIALLGASGCGLLGVELTSSPPQVRSGDPVTFDIKLTNFSQCPLETSAAVLVAFIPAEDFPFLVVRVDSVSPEEEEILELIREFFDALCSGGVPDLPMVASGASSCRRADGAIVCEMSGPAPAQAGEGGMSLSALGGRVRCDVDAGAMRCELRLPIAQLVASAGAAATTSTVMQQLTCLTAEEVGLTIGEDFEDEVDALCFLGTLPNIGGLGPQEMATGQIVLPARGSGRVRNLVFAIGGDESDAGVCKGGVNAGQACQLGSSSDCPGSECGEGICVNGTNPGNGCDESTEMADCGAGGTCVECDDVPGDLPALPIDCTETYVSPEPAPTMSPWGLGALAAGLLGAGTFWLRRRRCG